MKSHTSRIIITAAAVMLLFTGCAKVAGEETTSEAVTQAEETVTETEATRSDEGAHAEYSLYAVSMDGTTLLATEVYKDGGTIAFYNSGSGLIIIGENIADIDSWQDDGDTVRFSVAGEDMTVEVKDGVLTLPVEEAELIFIDRAKPDVDTDAIGAKTIGEMLIQNNNS